MRSPLVVSLLVALPACAPSPPAECWAIAYDPDGGVRALEANEALPVVLGPQGMYMAEIGLQARSIDPGNAEDDVDPNNPIYESRLSDGASPLAYRKGKMGFSTQPDGTYTLSDVRLIFGTTAPVAASRPCQLDVTISDMHGQRCNQSMSVLLSRP